MAIFTGSGTALATPFTDDGINFEAFSKNIDFQLENNTDALVVCGTTGEPSTMTPEERQEVIKFVIDKTQKKVPVIAGTGGNNTKKVIEDSQKAQKLGADALLVVLPYYNRTSQRGLVAHFNAVADNVDIPIIVYNVPSRTVVSMEAETLAEIAQHKNIAAMKEASGDIALIEEMVRLCGDNIDMYSGDDQLVLPLLACGGKGVISTVSNIAPKQMHDVVASFMAGDIEKSRELQYKLAPLIDTLFLEVNPIPLKAAMKFLKVDSGLLRLPLFEMGEDNQNKLKKAMIDFGFDI